MTVFAVMTAGIMFIVSMASIVQFVLSFERMPAEVTYAGLARSLSVFVDGLRAALDGDAPPAYVLQPGDDPQHIKKTLSQMLAEEKGVVTSVTRLYGDGLDALHVLRRVPRLPWWTVVKAAQRLGINRNTLHKKLKQYGLDGELDAD